MSRVLDRCEQALTAIMTVLFFVLTVVVTYQVVSRYVGPIPQVLWTEEVSRFCFVWMLFVGAAIAVRRNTHFTIDVIPPGRAPRLSGALDLVVPALVAVTALVIVAAGVRFTVLGMDRVSTTSGIPLGLVYAALPFSGLFILVFSAERLYCLLRNEPVPHAQDAAGEPVAATSAGSS